jgi:hypothetical protein
MIPQSSFSLANEPNDKMKIIQPGQQRPPGTVGGKSSTLSERDIHG